MDEMIKKVDEKLDESGKISCADALSVADDLGITPQAIGKELDRRKIKIKECMLGCFK